MDDDKTRIKPRAPPNIITDDDRTIVARPAGAVLAVDLLDAHGAQIEHFSLAGHITVGRAEDNAITVAHDVVSRHHLEVKREGDAWWVYNLNSTNGVYIDGRLIQHREQLHFPVLIGIGVGGFYLRIQLQQADATVVSAVQQSQAPVPDLSLPTHRNVSEADIEARLLATEDTPDMGDYTLMARRVIRQSHVKQAKSYKKVIWSLVAVCVVAAALAVYQHFALENTRKLALDMFYDIKTLEVSLSQADIKLEESAAMLENTLKTIDAEKLRISQEQLRAQQEQIAAERQRMRKERARLAKMKAKYREYVKEANSIRLRFPTDEQYENELIAKVARDLGESELELPEEFVAEVRKYIGYWQGTSRLQNSINTIERNDLLTPVIAMLQKYDLPLYFIYLPLQESNYDTRAIGPETRFGIAKGAWQLLADTALQYGVTPGPLAAVPEYDEQDGRFDFTQATQAAIKYLRKIYSTEAQASGLLVMASYNYGDTRVRDLIRQMPDNPRDRNFWTFLQRYELPAETRDYVFMIFSAAVIGEDPQHFGFKFNPPLYQAES